MKKLILATTALLLVTACGKVADKAAGSNEGGAVVAAPAGTDGLKPSRKPLMAAC